MSAALPLPIEAPEDQPAAAPQPVMHLSVPVYDCATYFADRPLRGLVFITDGEDGRWMPGWAEGADKGFADETYWTQRGYRPTHFAPAPAAPVDGVTI